MIATELKNNSKQAKPLKCTFQFKEKYVQSEMLPSAPMVSPVRRIIRGIINPNFLDQLVVMIL